MKPSVIVIDVNDWSQPIHNLLLSAGEEEPYTSPYMEELLMELSSITMERFRFIQAIQYHNNYEFLDGIEYPDMYGITKCLMDLRAYKLPLVELANMLIDIACEIDRFIRESVRGHYHLSKIIQVGTDRFALGVMA